MKVNTYAKNFENYIAVLLTFVVIGLLFILKTQEDNYRKDVESKISMGSSIIAD